MNEVVVEAVKEKIRVDCDEIDENEQCDQSVDCNFEKNQQGISLKNYKIILK